MKPLFAHDPAAPSLKEAFAGKLRIGAAVNTWDFAPGSPASEVIRRQFDILTLENESKPMYVQPEEGRFVYDKLDRFTAFGAENGIALRGHTLIWHGQCPRWFFENEDGSPASKERLLVRVRAHVTAVVSHCRDRIATWDVVNEVLADGGGMRPSRWYEIAGEDYIAEAFRAARAADPGARLLINDYNLESSEKKAETMYAFVKKLLEDGVPVDGIGMQMHLGPETDFEKLVKNAEMLASIRRAYPGFRLEMTELDVSAYPFAAKEGEEDLVWTPERDEALAAFYKKLFRFYLALSEEGVLDTVVFWGLCDGVSWLNGFPRRHTNYPLLIGRDYRLKRAFFDVIETASQGG